MKTILLIGGIVVTSVAFGWATRYQYTSAYQGRVELRENRWTGQTCTLRSVDENPTAALYDDGNKDPIGALLGNTKPKSKDPFANLPPANPLDDVWAQFRIPPKTVLAWTDCGGAR